LWYSISHSRGRNNIGNDSGIDSTIDNSIFPPDNSIIDIPDSSIDGAILPRKCSIKNHIKITEGVAMRRISLIWVKEREEYAIVFDDYRRGGEREIPSHDIFFVRLNKDGEKISEDIKVTDYVGENSLPSIAWTGSEYGIVWRDSRGEGPSLSVYFTRLDGRGTKIHEEFEVSDFQVNPTFIWSGSEFALSGLGYFNEDFRIFFQRLDSKGKKIGELVEITNEVSQNKAPSFIWTGNGYTITWGDRRRGGYNVFFVGIDSHGKRLQSQDIAVTATEAPSSSLSHVWTGKEHGIVWQDMRTGNYEIYFARMDKNGKKLTKDIRITRSKGPSLSPFIVWGEDEYGISWVEKNTNELLYFVCLNKKGQIISNSVIVTSKNNLGVDSRTVWNGNAYGIVYNEKLSKGHEVLYFSQIVCP
jgi:hypothetical protein